VTGVQTCALPISHIEALYRFRDLDERHDVTALIAEAVVILVVPHEHVATWTADDIAWSVAEDPFRRPVPEDDPAVGTDDEGAVARARERQVEARLNERHGADRSDSAEVARDTEALELVACRHFDAPSRETAVDRRREPGA